MFIDMSIIRNFIIRDFLPHDINKVWKSCPNRMLWEAVRAEDAAIISQTDVIFTIKHTPEIFVLSEPLPAFCRNTELDYTLVPSSEFVADFAEYAKEEPLYLLSKDFSWMIILTTENTPSGEQLCVLLKNFQLK